MLFLFRFGEEPLQSCEIMLHDIEESKRTNNSVMSCVAAKKHESFSPSKVKESDITSNRRYLNQRTFDDSSNSMDVVTSPIDIPSRLNHTSDDSFMYHGVRNSSTNDTNNPYVDFSIISENYWPRLNQLEMTESAMDEGNGDDTESFKHHITASNIINDYLSVYHDLKKPRKLNVYPTIGNVQLCLYFENDVTRRFSVSPIQVFLSPSALSSTHILTEISLPIGHTGNASRRPSALVLPRARTSYESK